MRTDGTMGPISRVPLRAAIYYRVSSDEQVEGFSLDAQRRALLDFCQARGWVVVEEYADEGKSARGDNIAKRPAFKRMMEAAQAGALDVVVVHKLDRFSRNVRITFEQFEVLHRHGVMFASVAEQGFDFTTPMGKVMLSLLAAFAQYYSDNLSQETKKGKAERKAQGLYNGWLPFGVKKNSQSIPVPDPATYPGLLLAFKAAAEGKSDREVAILLNDRGYRTTGNRGSNPFSKDTVRMLLQNRFYLGELPDGDGGWLEGAHEAVLDDALFNAAQAARGRRASVPVPVRGGARVYSLSGLARCHHCGGMLHIHQEKGKARIYCYRGKQAEKCAQRSTFLATYEEQIAQHLATFTIPEDYRTQFLAAQSEARTAADESAALRKRLETQLTNARSLFELGDITRAEYLERRERLQRELGALRTEDEMGAALDQAAAMLADLPTAWAEASQEERNALARLLFEEVHIKNEWVVAVKPQPTFAPFFSLDCQARRLSGGSDGEPLRVIEVVEPPLIPFFWSERTLYSRSAASRAARIRPACIPNDQLSAALARIAREGLRPVARSLGVSHETLRTKLIEAGYEDILADASRKHRITSAAPLPPPAPTKIPKSRYTEVVMLCQRHTQAEVAVMLGVSQMTIWRIVQYQSSDQDCKSRYSNTGA